MERINLMNFQGFSANGKIPNFFMNSLQNISRICKVVSLELSHCKLQ